MNRANDHMPCQLSMHIGRFALGGPCAQILQNHSISISRISQVRKGVGSSPTAAIWFVRNLEPVREHGSAVLGFAGEESSSGRGRQVLDICRSLQRTFEVRQIMEVSGRELLERFHFPKATRTCLASFALVVCLVVVFTILSYFVCGQQEPRHASGDVLLSISVLFEILLRKCD